MDYDKTTMPEAFNRGRNHGQAVVKLWMDTIAAHVEGEPIRRILDLGCGTGRFSPALSKFFDADVIGIDPSTKMLNEARPAVNGTRVNYASGAAEAIPLASGSVDLIFISMAFHHFTDPESAARECNRVLRPGGRLFLRTASREQIPVYAYVPFFPASRPILEQQIPSLCFQCEVFEAASFETKFSGLVTQQIAQGYPEYAEKLSARADSILIRLRDEDFEAGLNAVRRARSDGPVNEPINVVVFQKRQS